jgi:hypothetical protein
LTNQNETNKKIFAQNFTVSCCSKSTKDIRSLHAFSFFFLKTSHIFPNQKELIPNLKEKPTATIKSAAISLENT